jgi:hypothetical protein
VADAADAGEECFDRAIMGFDDGRLRSSSCSHERLKNLTWFGLGYKANVSVPATSQTELTKDVVTATAAFNLATVSLESQRTAQQT